MKILEILLNYSWILFIMLAAICNAIMDICKDKYYISIFNKPQNTYWWDGSISWKNKYYDRNIIKGRNKIPIWFTDAWHFFKSLMIVNLAMTLCVATIFYKPVYFYVESIIVFGLVWNTTFNLFYNKILRK